MKKFIYVVLFVFTLTLALSGCGKSVVEKGTRDENSYKNETIGITFNKPADWDFCSDEEIARVMGVTVDMLKDEMNSDDMKNLVEFIAIDRSNGDNINMTIEKLGLFNRGMSVDEYIEKSKEIIKEQNESANYEFYDVTKTKLGDVEFDRLKATATYSNTEMEQYCYFTKVGIHMVVITATTSVGMSPETIESYFA